MTPYQFREMFRAMQDGRGWLTDAEIVAYMDQIRSIPERANELRQLERVIEARRPSHQL